MTTPPRFLLDSDVFITAKNTYYAFDLCPGFWAAILREHAAGTVGSIDRVQAELLAGRPTENLYQWVQGTLPSGFFVSTQGAPTLAAFAQVLAWSQRSVQFTAAAKRELAGAADGWLVAAAMVSGATVVTNEQSRPEARNRVLLPDMCAQLGVPCVHTFDMLRAVSAHFHL
jgi:hypothetical protein